jgi:UDP-glucose 4-epimerase
MKTILVTGGAGFIGSHTVVELDKAGFKSIILDDLSNSKHDVLGRITKIIGKEVAFYKGNCSDKALLGQLFTEHSIDAVIHFAASKAVGESVENPLKYYRNNVGATALLLEELQNNGIQNFVFSSSCTVYGEPDSLPVTETNPVKKATSPYGNTKQICEELLEDLCRSAKPINAVSLRYFNPIGAHESGLIGELPLGVPANLIPFITQTAAGIRETLSVFGNDYNTPDGTCIRDYIHVVDLAKAHVAAVQHLLDKTNVGYYNTVNLGTGQGNSVLEIIETFQKVNNVKVNYQIKPRREGDVVAVYGSVAKAKELFGWQTEKTLEEALADAWRWQKSL